MPPLPFGHSSAQTTFDLDTASDAMAKIVPSMALYSRGNHKLFRSQIATTGVGSIRMIANAATPCRMEVEESQGWHLVMPYIGSASLKCDGTEYQLQSGANALLLPNMRRSTERAPSSVLIAAINIEKLNGYVATIAGLPAEAIVQEERPKALRIDRDKGLFQAFLQICKLVDATDGQEALAQSLGLEDLIYRWIATVWHQAANVKLAAGEEPASATRIDIACDLMRNAAERPLRMTDIEVATGLSSRALQYGFKARFGVTPMEWQRYERMLMAQTRLMQAAPHETITSIAHSMGFSSSAAFATLYKHHFGETPSETLACFRTDPIRIFANRLRTFECQGNETS